MSFEITIKGKTFTTTSKAHKLGLDIIDWLKANKNDWRGAATKFNLNIRTIKRKSRRFGYNPPGSYSIDKSTVFRAIKIDQSGGNINEIAEACGQSRSSLNARMRVFGYSTVTKSFSLLKLSPTKDTNSWDKILYTKFLSYDQDFTMANPFRLVG